MGLVGPAAGADFSPADVHGTDMTSGIPKFPNFNGSPVKTQQCGRSQRQPVSCQRDSSLHKESEVGVIAAGTRSKRKALQVGPPLLMGAVDFRSESLSTVIKRTADHI